uniref:Peptidyl-prolyl cis-trans isomerase n=1 Tax=Pyramimonas obovata TaxID=1411642 RepID=A0A7S0WJX8_9CHLO|mmetsp:Transcript_27902/g.61066  ORF Transcript_27902/g.61066 Transcript_27902/m.61066 type:complete len:216 (+) Transcript_27902:123-770(+)|eukprot:CAMPEP_0118932978 /NCGR_PEP_ID=MMETSP1169-20130426/10850_1 /TAXON_ID=36882 /ORGANISM="Pyramimonas obovata, Strain CCMP722" /LENGTH=215 /DNA_ID=CAMNT_0006875687 /DNA_START=100 /DNA_END=747 /DNA_ORIENTATION=-
MALANAAVALRLQSTARPCDRRSLRVVSSKSCVPHHQTPKAKALARQQPATFVPSILAGASLPWLSVSAALADADLVDAAASSTPEGYGMYVLSLTPIFLYGLYRTFLADDRTATASHILVKDEQISLDLKEQLATSSNLKEDFASLAAEYSTCPSKDRRGSLGTFRPGQMVPEFNDVVFGAEVNKVHGPVKTDFGYHLILIENRTDHKTGEVEE